MYKVIDLLEDEHVTVETTLNKWAAKGYEPFQVIRRATYSWRLILKRGPVADGN